MTGEVEIPFKLMVVGDFSLRESPTPLADRTLLKATRENFEQVMARVSLLVGNSKGQRLRRDYRGRSLWMRQPESVPVRGMIGTSRPIAESAHSAPGGFDE